MTTNRAKPSGPRRSEETALNGFLTTQRLAEEIGVHRATLAKWRMERRGPPFTRLGRRILYNIDSFQSWLARTEVSPVPEHGSPERIHPQRQRPYRAGGK